MNQFHRSVLLHEVTEALYPAPGKAFIDATSGGGGHTISLLLKGAKVLAIDRDPEAIEELESKIRKSKFEIGKDLILINDNFTNLGKIALLNNFKKVDGIIFDLGVSGYQLDQAKRGFSFAKEGPLDMRMDPKIKVTAEDLINNLDQRRLDEVIKTYGQEKLSRPIAGAVCSARQIKKIETTGDLAQIVSEVYRKYRVKVKIHPATRTFQALRIVVNSELLNLEEALPQTVELLKKGGRLGVISFHSLEDGIVKRFLKKESNLKVITKKPIGPGAGEILENPRARSAKLRIAEKL